MSDILALLREHLDVVIAISSALVAFVSAFVSRAENRRDAIDRANALKARLESRRPGLFLYTSQRPATPMETRQ